MLDRQNSARGRGEIQGVDKEIKWSTNATPSISSTFFTSCVASNLYPHGTLIGALMRA